MAAAAAPAAQSPDNAALVARARGIHDRVITLDTHVDISPQQLHGSVHLTIRSGSSTQVNLPKMEEGGLDAAFLIVYVGQNASFTAEAYARAYQQAIEKFEAIHRLAEEIAPEPRWHWP